jgi:hypothetical protein
LSFVIRLVSDKQVHFGNSRDVAVHGISKLCVRRNLFLKIARFLISFTELSEDVFEYIVFLDLPRLVYGEGNASPSTRDNHNRIGDELAGFPMDQLKSRILAVFTNCRGGSRQSTRDNTGRVAQSPKRNISKSLAGHETWTR